MKILITGVAGFLGSHLAQNLSESGHKVIGVDNMMGGYEDNIYYGGRVSKSMYENQFRGGGFTFLKQ